MAPYLRETMFGVEIDVLVQPRASRTRVVGPHDDRLKVQLAAPPVDGAANDALILFFAQALGVAKREVTLMRGEGSRRKTLYARGVGLAEAAAALGGDGS